MEKLGLSPKTVGADLLAGLVGALTSIPDAMASAILAGLNPIQGLYAIIVGTPVGALATGSVFMTVAITSAMALTVGDSLAGYSGDELLEAVITLTILVGLFALLLGVLKLGTMVQLVPQEDGSLLEGPPPEEPPSHDVTLLGVYGTVFFAAAYTLEQILPSPLEARRAVVILRLRGYEDVGSTLIGVLERYAGKLKENGRKLLLCGVSEGVKHRLERTETTETIPEADIFMAEDRLGSSTQKALAAAKVWLAH